MLSDTGILHTRGNSGRTWVLWALVPVYVLVFGEAFVRLFAPVAVIPRYVTGAPYGVRMGMPNMTFRQTSAESNVQIRTNSRGIRADREYPYEKPPGTCRVLLFGDSFFVGYEVSLEDSFAWLLEKKLNASGHRCEVVNLAVSGFGTAEMLVTLREEGLRYHPDIVVFSSHVSDLDDNVRSALYALDDGSKLVRQNATYLPGIGVSDALSRIFLYRWVVENSQLYSALRERAAYYVKAWLLKFEKRAVAPGAGGSDRFEASRGGAKRPGILNLRLLEEARRVSETGHAHFCVLEIPFNKSRSEFSLMLPDYGEATRRELHVYDPTAEFTAAARTSRKLFYETGHGHLSPEGNELLASFFFSRLAESGWLRQ